MMNSSPPNIRNQKTEGGILNALVHDITSYICSEISPSVKGSSRYYTRMAIAAHQRFEAICAASNLGRQEAMALHSRILDMYKRSGKFSFSFETHFLQTLPDEFNVRGKWTPEKL